VTTVTVRHPISAITTGGVGCTLAIGEYELVSLVGSAPDIARVYDPETSSYAYIGRNDPCATFNWEGN
jgi:hypothetical protein